MQIRFISLFILVTQCDFLIPFSTHLFHRYLLYFRDNFRTSLVVQWVRILLPMQGTWIQSLVWKDFTCHRAAKSERPNYGAHRLQPQKPLYLEPVLHKRSHCNQKPILHCKQRVVPAHHNWRKPVTSNKDLVQPKKKKKDYPYIQTTALNNCFTYSRFFRFKLMHLWSTLCIRHMQNMVRRCMAKQDISSII